MLVVRTAVVAVGLLGLVTLTACREGRRPDALSAPLAVEVVRPVAGDGVNDLVVSGHLTRQSLQDVAFRVPGLVTEVRVHEGDRVRRGQIVAVLDATELQLKVRQTRGEYETLRRELARYQTLSKQGFAPLNRVDLLEASLARASAAAERAALQLGWAKLVSPSDGIVLKRLKEPGEMVRVGEQVVELSDSSSPLVLRASVSSTRLRDLRPGAAAIVQVEGQDGVTLAGTVLQIGVVRDPRSGAFEVQVGLPSGTDVESGLFATARIQGARSRFAGLQRLPAETLVSVRDGQATVFIVEPASQRARKRSVGFVGLDGDDALVKGLEPDTLVIESGAGFVADGQIVSPRPKASVPPRPLS